MPSVLKLLWKFHSTQSILALISLRLGYRYEKVTQLMSEEQLKAEGSDPLAIAKAAGFSISIEDLAKHRQELSDEEMEGVAGGTLCKAAYS